MTVLDGALALKEAWDEHLEKQQTDWLDKCRDEALMVGPPFERRPRGDALVASGTLAGQCWHSSAVPLSTQMKNAGVGARRRALARARNGSGQ